MPAEAGEVLRSLSGALNSCDAIWVARVSIAKSIESEGRIALKRGVRDPTVFIAIEAEAWIASSGPLASR